MHPCVVVSRASERGDPLIEASTSHGTPYQAQARVDRANGGIENWSMMKPGRRRCRRSSRRARAPSGRRISGVSSASRLSSPVASSPPKGLPPLSSLPLSPLSFLSSSLLLFGRRCGVAGGRPGCRRCRRAAPAGVPGKKSAWVGRAGVGGSPSESAPPGGKSSSSGSRGLPDSPRCEIDEAVAVVIDPAEHCGRLTRRPRREDRDARVRLRAHGSCRAPRTASAVAMTRRALIPVVLPAERLAERFRAAHLLRSTPKAIRRSSGMQRNRGVARGAPARRRSKLDLQVRTHHAPHGGRVDEANNFIG